MQLAAIKFPHHCHAQGFFGSQRLPVLPRRAPRPLELQRSSSHPLGLQVASLIKEKTLNPIFLTRQLKEKNQFAI